MADKSSYLRYLPPVLWENEPNPPAFSLGSLLRIFEKLLTGIDDGVEIRHGDHSHDAIAAQVGRLYELFDPWRTPPESLSWLASWVGLDFPTLQGRPVWDEYQQRKLISEATRVYRQRGLRAGLNRLLSLYSTGETRARVAIDDGSRLLTTRPEPGRVAQIGTFMAQGAQLGGGPVLRVLSEGLIRPWCILAVPGGFVVGDAGAPPGVTPQPKGPVWHIDASGRYFDLTGVPPEPRPLMAPALPLSRVAALAPRIEGGGQAVYVLYLNGDLYRIPQLSPLVQPTRVGSVATANTTFRPVAMAVEGIGGNLLILDRGDGPGTANPPAILSVLPTTPPAVTRRNLATVIEPLSLLILPDGKLLIGDGREQAPLPSGLLPTTPGNLVMVDRSATPWTETLLLGSSSPLVAPTAIVQDDATHVYVLDAGLKPFVPPGDPFVLGVAEPATVYRVDLGASTPTAVRAVENGQLVFPTGMAASGGQLVICDPGQPEVFGLNPVWSRLLPHRFGVVIHFTESRLPTVASQRATVQRQVVGNIRDIVDQQKPAHALWNLITAIP